MMMHDIFVSLQFSLLVYTVTGNRIIYYSWSSAWWYIDPHSYPRPYPWYFIDYIHNPQISSLSDRDWNSYWSPAISIVILVRNDLIVWRCSAAV